MLEYKHIDGEHWKPVVGYEGIYEVSSLGRVKSLLRSGGIFKEYMNKRGYNEITLTRNKRQYHEKVHRLVANAFLENPDNKPFVNHIDGNKMNNSVENLEWCTVSENNIHAYRVLKRGHIWSGKKHNWHDSRIPVYQFNLDGTFVKKWPSIIDTHRLGGYCANEVGRACRGIIKTYRGFIWRYYKNRLA